MLGASRKEFKLKTLFLHFLYLSKVNKERGYINRNGKMPVLEEREEEKKGYKSVYMITLRKFLTGFFCNGEGNSNKLKILKSRSFDGHQIYPENGSYEYGSSQICDALVKLSFLNHFIPNRFNPHFSYKNHEFLFNRNGYSRNNHADNVPPFSITYKWDINKKDQTYAPIALDNYLLYSMENASNINGIEDRQMFAEMSTKLLTKMLRDGMLSQPDTRESESEQRVDTSTITGVSSKYGVPRTIILDFLNTFRDTLNASSGLESPQVFEFVKNVTTDRHPNITSFEYNDFERLAA